MDLIIDVRMVNNNLHGIARYTYELVKGLSKKEDIKLRLLTNDVLLSKEIFETINPGIEYIKMKSKFLSPMEVIELPFILNKYKTSIFHSPSFSASPFIKIKSCITIHDLNHLALPMYYSRIKQYYYKLFVKPFAIKCKHIFTVSNFSKKEIVKWLSCDDSKVTVTYNGIDEKFTRIYDDQILCDCTNKYNLPQKFILYIGNLKPHKNINTLIKALKYVEKDYFLVINGKPNESVLKMMDECNVSERVKFIGYVNDDDLPALYSLAGAFVFPSFYEGFGLPPLEAVSCGCSAVVSNTSSIPEIMGENAKIVKPLDYEEFAKEINMVLENPAPIKYKNKKFKWEKCVENTYKVYQTL